MTGMLYDAHNHLQDAWLEPHVERLSLEAQQLGIAAMVVNGTHPDDWSQVAELARRYPWVRPSYGVHPWQSGRRGSDWREQLEHYLTADPAASVGEIGLDRWILDHARPGDPRLEDTSPGTFAEQMDVFEWQFTWAGRHDRTATVHCLEAWGPLYEVVSTAERPSRGFLLHAYGGSRELADRFVELGAYFSFGPAFLDPQKDRTREVFRSLPLERIVVETDAPAMPPPIDRVTHPLPNSPNGVRVNSPSHLPLAYAGLAELRGLDPAQLIEQVGRNFHRLFGSR